MVAVLSQDEVEAGLGRKGFKIRSEIAHESVYLCYL